MASTALVMGVLTTATSAAQAADPPPPPQSAFAQQPTELVTITSAFAPASLPGDGKCEVVAAATVKTADDGSYILRLPKVQAAEVINAAQQRYESDDPTGAWGVLGDRPVGIVQAVATDGSRVQVPVIFVSAQAAGDDVVVTAIPQGGVVSTLAAQYMPHLQGVATPTIPAGKYSQIAITGWPAASEAWRWSDTGSGSVQISGGQFTVRFDGDAKRGTGVQPGGQSASVDWADVVNRYASYAGQGTPTRLVVTGGAPGAPQNSILLPTQAILDGSTLVITGTVPPQAAGAGGPAVDLTGPQGQLLLSLETPAGGNTTTYVVVAGDSIASGEGARFGGTYINPSFQKGYEDEAGQTGGILPTADRVADRVALFCDSIDLACTGATIGADDKVTYSADPGIVYETGSWEGAEKCHRSKTAPGTWLARYYKVQLGLDVEPINIACSGATTPNIIDTPFKGQNPQSQDLADLAAWLPISHVVATIGANDIRFSEVATKCLSAPIDAILGGGGDLSNPSAALARIGRIFDATSRGADGSAVSANPFFDPKTLCSESLRPLLKLAVADVRAKVANAMNALHTAAPDAKVVLSNYPSLVPDSAHTYFPRQPWMDLYVDQVVKYGPDPFGSLCNGNGFDPDNNPATVQVWVDWLKCSSPNYDPPGGVPTEAPDPDLIAGVLAGNPTNIWVAQNIFNVTAATGENGQNLNIGHAGNAFVSDWGTQMRVAPILGYGALMFGFDQDWAAKEVIPTLNKALVGALADADAAGAWSIPVDMTQAFNGRSLGGQFVGHIADPFRAVFGVPVERSNPIPSLPKVLDPEGTGPGPSVSRAEFVNNVFPGRTEPVLCPGPDAVAGTAAPACIGESQEALHPNWRGQAAEGQCIVAVVTGAFGGSGNACVRSVGSSANATLRTYNDPFPNGGPKNAYISEPYLFSEVAGEDSLCLTTVDLAHSTEQGVWQPCTSSTAADPTWDTERWKQGQVRWKGATDVHWR